MKIYHFFLSHSKTDFQLPLAVLPIINSHTGATIVEVHLIYDHVTVCVS
jgi:hypothetical protein